MTAYATEAKNLPLGEHWAILEFSSITIPGDERSRQAPGHGYPEHTERVAVYRVFGAEDAMQTCLMDLMRGPADQQRYVGLHVAAVYRAQPHIVVQRQDSNDVQ